MPDSPNRVDPSGIRFSTRTLLDRTGSGRAGIRTYDLRGDPLIHPVPMKVFLSVPVVVVPILRSRGCTESYCPIKIADFELTACEEALILRYFGIVFGCC